MLVSRTQFAVGQGGMHLATLINDDFAPTRTANFVFDCGGTNKDIVKRELDSLNRDSPLARWYFLDEFTFNYRGQQLRNPMSETLIVLSHIDSDHVNGLAELRRELPDLSRVTVLLPYLEVWERLMEARADLSNLDMVADPAGTIEATLEGARVREVRAREGDGPLPRSQADGGDDADQDLEAIRGGARNSDLRSGTRVRAWTGSDWVFHLFVPHIVPETKREFVRAYDAYYADDLKGPRPAPPWEWSEESKELLLEFITTNIQAIRFATVTANKYSGPNGTSLAVYCGPVSNHQEHESEWCWAGSDCHSERGWRALGWLHTGDLNLNKAEIYDDFWRELGQYSDNVGSIVLPHHGSEEGYNSRLIGDFGPQRVLACSGPRAGWNHPNAEIWASLVDQVSCRVHVTRYEGSRFSTGAHY
jgi:hypothetical protein